MPGSSDASMRSMSVARSISRCGATGALKEANSLFFRDAILRDRDRGGRGIHGNVSRERLERRRRHVLELDGRAGAASSNFTQRGGVGVLSVDRGIRCLRRRTVGFRLEHQHFVAETLHRDRSEADVLGAVAPPRPATRGAKSVRQRKTK
jgi:hypothetical protein